MSAPTKKRRTDQEGAVSALRQAWQAAPEAAQQQFLRELASFLQLPRLAHAQGSPPPGQSGYVVATPRPRRRRERATRASAVHPDVAQTVPWRDAFPAWDEAQRPGLALEGARHKENMTQQALAAATGIPQRHLSEMEHGKRPIGKERAKKLAAVLQVDYRILL